jgi:hypothetical protein
MNGSIVSIDSLKNFKIAEGPWRDFDTLQQGSNEIAAVFLKLTCYSSKIYLFFRPTNLYFSNFLERLPKNIKPFSDNRTSASFI